MTNLWIPRRIRLPSFGMDPEAPLFAPPVDGMGSLVSKDILGDGGMESSIQVRLVNTLSFFRINQLLLPGSTNKDI